MSTPSCLTYVRTATHTLTPNCINRCGFCSFPLRSYRAVPSLKRWRQSLRASRAWEASGIHLTAGEPVTKDKELLQTVRYYGHRDAVEYLEALLQTAQEERHGGFLISLEMGELRRADLQRLRTHICDYTVGIVPFDPTIFDTALLWNAPTMVPPRRLDLIQTLGHLRIPTTVNMLVGLGECESSRLQTLAALAELHAHRRHLQAVRITPFEPRRGTALEDHPAPEPDLVVRTVRQAAEILGAVPVQVDPFAVEEYVERCVDAGARDLGPIAADPSRDLAGLAGRWGEIERRLVARGHRLVERLVVTEPIVSRGVFPETQQGAIARQLDRLESRHAQAVVEPIAAAEDSQEAAADTGA